MSEPSRGRRALQRLALFLGATLFALLLAEVAVRALDLGPKRWAHPWHLESEDKRVGLDVYPDDPRDAFPLDLRDAATRARFAERLPEVERRWERTPHAVPFRYSAELCRGPAIGDEGARPRLLVIGDSFTEGQGVTEEGTFAAQLEAQLGGAVEVLNCGRRGYDFPRLAEWFDEKLAELDPDWVLYAFTPNDPQQSEAFHERQAFLNDWILDRRRMFTEEHAPAPSFWESRCAGLIGDRLEAAEVAEETTRWYREMVGEPNAEGWEATRAHVAAMARRMEARGGRFAVAMWPLFVDLGEAYPFAEVHEVVAEAFEAEGATVWDSLPAFRGRSAPELWVHPADRHPNEVAHGVFAEVIAAGMEEAGWRAADGADDADRGEGE